MGVIFVLMGSFAFFMKPSAGVPPWIGYAAGGMFVFAGLFMLAHRLENKLYAEILAGAALLAFLTVFHWVSFGPGERMGTATKPFSVSHGANVKTYFAVFTVLLDLALLAGLVKWFKGRKD